MISLETIDKIDNHNDLLIALESEITKGNFEKEILIREVFVLWHILVENINCENFNENFIEILLRKKYKIFKDIFKNDSDFNFIMGWMLSVASWHFNNDLTEDDGYKLLYKAYKNDSKNSLFKWAVRGQINLSNDEIKRLNEDLKQNLNLYFNYGTLIREYFLPMF